MANPKINCFTLRWQKAWKYLGIPRTEWRCKCKNRRKRWGVFDLAMFDVRRCMIPWWTYTTLFSNRSTLDNSGNRTPVETALALPYQVGTKHGTILLEIFKNCFGPKEYFKTSDFCDHPIRSSYVYTSKHSATIDFFTVFSIQQISHMFHGRFACFLNLVGKFWCPCWKVRHTLNKAHKTSNAEGKFRTHCLGTCFFITKGKSGKGMLWRNDFTALWEIDPNRYGFVWKQDTLQSAGEVHVFPLKTMHLCLTHVQPCVYI